MFEIIYCNFFTCVIGSYHLKKLETFGQVLKALTPTDNTVMPFCFRIGITDLEKHGTSRKDITVDCNALLNIEDNRFDNCKPN